MSTTRKVVLITGGARGIGRTIAQYCAESGYAVAVNYLTSEEPARSLVDSLNGKGADAVALKADVSDPASVNALVDRTIDTFGSVDVLISNAGIAEFRSFEQADIDHYDRIMSANARSAFLVSQACIPHMIRQGQGGRLLFFSSLAARTGGGVSPAYAASKGALEGMMHYYATYLLPHRITSNAIAPALVETEMVQKMNLPPLSQLPLGRLGRAEELWPAVRMVLETEYMTGQTIHLNAGRYMT